MGLYFRLRLIKRRKMEIELKVKATPREMQSYFEFDEVLNIRYYEKLEQDIYRIRIRIQECDGLNKSGVRKLDYLKKKLVKLCPKEFGVAGEAVFEKKRKFYAPNDYWLERYVNHYADLIGCSVVSLRKETDE